MARISEAVDRLTATVTALSHSEILLSSNKYQFENDGFPIRLPFPTIDSLKHKRHAATENKPSSRDKQNGKHA